MKIDIFKKLRKIKNQRLKLKLIDNIMSMAIPFNRGLGFKITTLTAKKVVVNSPSKKARQNHIKGAHACALALLGEYPAGLLLAQNYSPENYRFILGELKMEYKKQGRGLLTSISKISKKPVKNIKGEAWIDMSSEITNSKGDLVALCHTKWQLKSWDLVEKQKN